MELSYIDGLFLAKTRYGEWEAKNAGFLWDPKLKIWWTDDPEKAYVIRKAAEPAVQQQIIQLCKDGHERDTSTIRESQATDAEIAVPVPDGLNYLPYQRAGIAYALKRRATLIGDEMGLGKTVQSIGVLNGLSTQFSGLRTGLCWMATFFMT